MTLDDVLKGVTCTKPFTPLDARALHMLIHTSLPGSGAVDVYTTRGDLVYVRVETENGTIARELPVV